MENAMKTQVLASPRWSTASIDAAQAASPMEFATLALHLQSCQKKQGSLLALQPMFGPLRGLVSAHLVTTLGLIAMLLDVCSRWF
jgi:hypothetical protein